MGSQQLVVLHRCYQYSRGCLLFVTGLVTVQRGLWLSFLLHPLLLDVPDSRYLLIVKFSYAEGAWVLSCCAVYRTVLNVTRWANANVFL